MYIAFFFFGLEWWLQNWSFPQYTLNIPNGDPRSLQYNDKSTWIVVMPLNQ